MIGVLACQGAFIEHIFMLNKLGVASKEIRKKADLDTPFKGLILPGGESSTIGKLLHDLELYKPLKELIVSGMPVFGTCAGLILLAKNIENDTRTHFGTMDIHVQRNGYGKQLGSFYTKGLFNNTQVEMPFIRAPYITKVEENVEILSVIDGKIVAAKQENQLVTAFHPEVTQNTYIHEYFLSMIK